MASSIKQLVRRWKNAFGKLRDWIAAALGCNGVVVQNPMFAEGLDHSFELTGIQRFGQKCLRPVSVRFLDRVNIIEAAEHNPESVFVSRHSSQLVKDFKAGHARKLNI